MRHKLNLSVKAESFPRTDDHLVFTVNETATETIINVQGIIGDSWDGLDAASLVDRVQSLDGPIRLRINTPGGGVFDAVDVYQALVEHPAKVTADIIYSWSAGTILTSAADEIRAGASSVFGIHRASTGFILYGNEADMENAVETVITPAREFLRDIDEEIAVVLADRSGNSRRKIKEWMIGEDGQDGTEWIGSNIVEAGFADTLLETKKKPEKPESSENMRRIALDLLRRRAGLLRRRAGLDAGVAKP